MLIDLLSGIDFKVRQTIDGGREIQAFWKESELNDASKIRTFLDKDPLWEVYQLRAVVLMQGRVDAQLATLDAVGSPIREGTAREGELATPPTANYANPTGPWRLAAQLRTLERDMLLRTKKMLDDQVLQLFIHVFLDAPSSEY